MAVAVLVPWSAGCPHREAAWAWIRRQYATHHPTWEIVVGTADGPWCKARAVQDALSRTTADILVITDADCWADSIQTAIDAVAAGHPWARPHENVHRLTATATDQLLDTGHCDIDDCDPHPYRGMDGGGIAVLRRTTYDDIPLDPRFAGWGGEDASWGQALHVLAGHPYGVSAPLLHLWHPPQPDAPKRRGPGGGRYMNDNNLALLERYKHARPSPTAMRTLVDEAREALDGEHPSGHQPQRDPRPPALR